MKKLTLLLMLFVLLTSFYLAHGQNNTIYKHHFLCNQIINPATAGSEFFPVLIGTASKQWTGINNSPNQQILGGSFRIGNFNFYNPKMYVNKTNLTAYERIGVGFVLFNNKEGPITNKGGKLSYSFHIPIEHNRLSLGMSVGFFNQTIDENGFSPIDPNDPIIHYGKESYSRFNSSIGAYYYSANYFVGASITDMLPITDEIIGNENIKQDFHIHGGYMITTRGDFNFEPSIYAGYYDYNEFQFQINAKIYYKYLNWLNVYFHSRGDIGLKIASKVNRVHIAYGFSTNASRIALYNYGTHEISIGTNIGIRRLENF